MQASALVELSIPPRTLGALGAMVGGPSTVISPLHFGDQQLSAEASQALRSRGILDQGGRLTSTAHGTFEGLRGPTAYARIRLATPAGFYEHVVFFSREAIMLSTVGSEIVVRDPAPVEEITGLVITGLGYGSLNHLGLSAELPWAEGLALAVAMDLQRRATLSALAVNQVPQAAAFTPEDLARAVREAPQESRWFAGLVSMLGQLRGLNRALDFRPAVEALVSAGHVQRQAGSFVLSDRALVTAYRMLVINEIMTLEAGRLGPAGTGSEAYQVILQAGPNDVLTVEVLDGKVAFESPPSAQVVEGIRIFLTRPDALPLPVVPVAPVVQAPPAQAVCPSCGTPSQPNQRFCSGCGASLVAQPGTCPACGTANAVGAHFCASCGHKMA